MPQFPVSDAEGIQDGLNYVLSGPSGTGQNFASFGAGTLGDLTGNFRPPYTILNATTTPAVDLYVAPIALSTAEMLDERTWRYTYTTPLAQPAFQLGQPITVTGVADPYYDGPFTAIGVIESTTTYVIARSQESYTVVANSTGGTVELDTMDTRISTDCNAKVTVTSAQDRVVLSAQLNNTIYVDAAALPGSLVYTVEINRYVASPTNDVANPDFRFNYDATVISKKKTITTTVVQQPEEETLFINFIDQPGPGYYWYILEVKFKDLVTGQIVTNSQAALRSFTAQVLKA